MTRSPLSYPLNRGGDMDVGAADLQTDVMRFMAILSLCLVAIFALVQSIPMTPPMPQSPPVRLPAAFQPAAPIPEPEVPEQRVETPPEHAPEPASVPAPESAPVPPRQQTVERRKPVAAPPPQPTASAAMPAPTDEGFTLRFESDYALRRLVARNEIGLYAIQSKIAVRMNVNRGAVSFWPASLPAQFHEMDEATVPDDVMRALRRSGTAGPIKWGVTLPARLSRELNRYLSEQSGGDLIIGGDGAMRLE